LFLPYLLSLVLTQSSDNLTLYADPENAGQASDFTVLLNEKEAFVYDSPVGAFINFEATSEVEVKIKSEVEAKWVDLRPKSKGIHPDLKDGVISFWVTPPINLSLEINGDIKRPLFIFANNPSVDKPDPNDPDVHYFEAGKIYDLGPVTLNDNDEVYIEGGAVVKGSFKAENAKSVRIHGRGIIDGTNVRGEEDYREAVKNYRTWRRLIHFKNCYNSEVEGVILLNSNTWNIVPDNSVNVDIDNIKILCGNPSDDGIDILRSSKVNIRNSFIRSKDDCIALKTLFEAESNIIFQDIRVENCVLWSAEWGNGIEIGFETLTDVIQNATFSDCDIIHVEGGAAFSIHNSDYATVRNITFENIRVEDARDKLIDLAIFMSLFSRDNPYEIDEFYAHHYLKGTWANVVDLTDEQKLEFSAGRGNIRDIKFTDIEVEGHFPFSVINGYDPTHKINEVRIENLIINGQKMEDIKQARIYTKFAENISFNHSK